MFLTFMTGRLERTMGINDNIPEDPHVDKRVSDMLLQIALDNTKSLEERDKLIKELLITAFGEDVFVTNDILKEE